MAMNGNRLGDKIVDALKAAGYLPNLTGPTEARVRAEWKVIASEIVSEIDVHADIVLETGDIQVLPGTFVDSFTSAPTTGLGTNETVTLEGKIA
jgi:hypothetical protein